MSSNGAEGGKWDSTLNAATTTNGVPASLRTDEQKDRIADGGAMQQDEGAPREECVRRGRRLALDGSDSAGAFAMTRAWLVDRCAADINGGMRIDHTCRHLRDDLMYAVCNRRDEWVRSSGSTQSADECLPNLFGDYTVSIEIR